VPTEAAGALAALGRDLTAYAVVVTGGAS
jgi:hypothetical protein